MSIKIWGKSVVLAYFGPKISHFGHIFWDMDFKCVLHLFSIDIKWQIKLEVNWTQIDYFNLRKPQKWPYLKIPFYPSVNHQKANSSYIFYEFVWNF